MTGGQQPHPDQIDVPEAAVGVGLDAWRDACLLNVGREQGIRMVLEATAPLLGRAYAAAELEDAAVVILQNRPTIPVSDDTRQKFALAERSTRNRIACHLRDRARELRGGHDSDTGGGT